HRHELRADPRDRQAATRHPRHLPGPARGRWAREPLRFAGQAPNTDHEALSGLARWWHSRPAVTRPLLIVSSSAPPQLGGISSLLEIICTTLMHSTDRELQLLCRPGTGQGLAHVVHDRLVWPRQGVLNLPFHARNALLFRQLIRRHRFEQVIFLEATARLYGLRVAAQGE